MTEFEVTLRVRQWVEYIHVVTAEDEDDALKKAMTGEGFEDVDIIQDEINDEDGEPIIMKC